MTTTTTTTTTTAAAAAANCYWSNRFHELLLVEGYLDVKFPTIWTDGKAEVGRIREETERRAEKRKSQNKEDADARRVRKVAKRCDFQCFMAAEGRKIGSLKPRVWSHLGKCETKNCTHAVVARNLLGSERAKKTTCSDHRWKLKC